MDWQEVETLVRQAQRPLPNADLENLRIPNEGQRHYYRFLYLLVERLKPALALEIGIEGGHASAHMVAAAKGYGGHVIGLDILPNAGSVVKVYDNFHLVVSDATQPETWREVASLVERYGPIGLVFQDSSHHYLKSKEEWDRAQPLLAPGAVWVCDDITPAFHDPEVDPPGKGMVQYWNELPVSITRKRLYPDILNFGSVIGVVLL